MLKDAFTKVYSKFKLHFYKEVLALFENREAGLTRVEVFCVDAIVALGRPTVNEFAAFMRISSPNAAYKINSLIRKGYVQKVQSESDRREFDLEVTEKYMTAYNSSLDYMNLVVKRISERFSPEDCQKLAQMLEIVSTELMPEVESAKQA